MPREVVNVLRMNVLHRVPVLWLCLALLLLALVPSVPAHAGFVDCVLARRSDNEAVQLKLTTDQDGEVTITIGANVVTFPVRAGEELDTGLLRISGGAVEIKVFSDGRLTDECTIPISEISEAYERFCIALPLVADFDCSPTEGEPPLTITCTDQSEGEIETWVWDFGDGSTSTQRNPNHTYIGSGNYAITLTVQGPGGSNTKEHCCIQVLRTGVVRITLEWWSTADLDLHVTDPSGCEVYWDNERCPSGGELDVDANADCSDMTTTPVENIIWPEGQAPEGEYLIWVNHYDKCSSPHDAEPFRLTIEVEGQSQEYNEIVASGEAWQTGFTVEERGTGQPESGDKTFGASRCPGEADPFAPPETIVHLHPRMAVVFDPLGRGDVGWNDLVAHGLQYMPEEIGEIAVYYSSHAADMDSITTMLAEGEDFDLIVYVGWLYVDALDYIARDFPQQRFAVIGAWWTEAPNVMAIDFRNDEGTALAGALAALAAAEYEYDRVGVIAGFENPYFWAAEAGYRFGVHWANQWYEDAFGSDPNVHVSYAYTGGLADAERSYDEAIKQLEEGAGVLFGFCPREDAAGIQSALSEWAKAYEITSAPPYYLGFDAYADWLFAGRFSLGSVVARVDAACYAALRSIVEDRFTAGTTWMGLAEGGVALSTEEDLLRELAFAVDAGLADVSDYQETIDNWIRNRESIPDWVWQAVAELRCQIITRAVVLPVPETYEEMERIRVEYP